MNPVGCYSKYHCRVSPGQHPTSSFHSRFPIRCGESSLLTRMGELILTPTAAVQSTPSLLFLLAKLPAASGENLGHGTLQMPGLLTNTSLFMEVMTKPSKSFFACPQLSDLLHSSDFSNEIVSQREEWNQVSGLESKWFLCSEAQGQTAGRNELLD